MNTGIDSALKAAAHHPGGDIRAAVSGKVGQDRQRGEVRAKDFLHERRPVHLSNRTLIADLREMADHILGGNAHGSCQ